VYLDRNARELVLRFAYAGQPLSGKTHSIRALMRLLRGAAMNAAVLSPHEENGRTEYFDWATYRGGSVQGNPVRCQIITVPGQDTHAARRKLLIESADVVVFVVDSDARRLAEGKRSYEEILPWLVRAGGSSIPLIFQCNKRDLPTAVPIEQIRRQLGLGAQCQLFESTATSGRGIRMAFVAALRAASAQAEGLHEYEPPSDAARAASGEQLLELIQRLEAGLVSPVSRATRVIPATEHKVAELAARLTEAPSEVLAIPTAPRDSVLPPPVERVQRSGPSLEALRRDPPKQRPPTPRWSGQGPRPAVMPAADWRALAPAHRSAAKVATPAPKPAGEPPPRAIEVAPAPLESVRVVEAPKPRPALPPAFETASARPAVMPIAAWREWLQAHEPKAPVEPPPAASTPASDAVTTDSPVAGDPVTDNLSTDSSTTDTSTTDSAIPPSPITASPITTGSEMTPIQDEGVQNEDSGEESDSVPLPLPDQPLVNVWPVATWQSLSPHFYQPPKHATCQNAVWTGEVAPGWQASSAALFGDHETGLEALGVEIQRRERLRGYLWPYRCLVLCNEGDGYWRLWELVRTATTLDQILKWILLQSGPGKAAQSAGHLVMIGRAYLKMLESLPQGNAPFAIDFSNIAQYERRLVYTGWIDSTGMDAAPRGEEDPLASLAEQLRLHLPVQIPQGIDVLEICDELQRMAPDSAQSRIAELFCSLLMRYVDARPDDASAGVRP
jgi:hypothetical protein